MEIMVALIKSLRPKQWIKNLFIFAGIVFAGKFFVPEALYSVLSAFGLFCATSSGIYILNDIIDLPHDREHPVKRKRPIASGQFPLPVAKLSAGILLVGALTLAFLLSTNLGLIIALYVITHIAYSLYLKRIVILDVLIVAFGFLLRVIAGAVVIPVTISSWLLVCTILISLFLILAKRRQEIIISPEGESRPVLQEYSLSFIDQIISAIAASTITAYSLYAFSGETIQKFGGRYMGYTIPFVLYGILRYLYLIHKRSLGEEPEKILLTDPPFIINLGLWILTVFIIVYFFAEEGAFIEK